MEPLRRLIILWKIKRSPEMVEKIKLHEWIRVAESNV